VGAVLEGDGSALLGAPESADLIAPRLALEIIVCSVEDAVAAAEGGASRLEIVRDLAREGLTPSFELVRAIAARVAIPVRAMVRESEPFDVESADEIARLCEQARRFATLRIDGVVLGFLSRGEIDLGLTSRVLDAARPLRATFHRAFDEARDPDRALAELKTLPQIDRILSTGGNGPWEARAERLAALARRAAPEIAILPGAGVDEEALAHIGRHRELGEAHIGRAARIPTTTTAPVSLDRVRRLAAVASAFRRT